MESRTDPYDVVIVGCGPPGALLAAELRLHGARVRLFAGIPSPQPELATAHGYMLGIPQAAIVRIVEAHAVEVGAQVRHGQAFVEVEQDGVGGTVETADGGRFRSRWLVACDGARIGDDSAGGGGPLPGRGACGWDGRSCPGSDAGRLR